MLTGQPLRVGLMHRCEGLLVIDWAAIVVRQSAEPEKHPGNIAP